MADKLLPVHFSRLKHIERSPAAYVAACKYQYADKTVLLQGRCVHGMLLGGVELAVYPGQRRGKAWDEFKADNQGKEIVTETEYARCNRAFEAVRNHPIAADLLDQLTHREQSLEWRAEGLPCRGRVDGYSTEAGTLIELKTARDASVPKFQRDGFWRGYHAQLDWYRYAIEQVHGPGTIKRVYTIAVEVEPPHHVTVHELTELLLMQGRSLWRNWLAQVQQCLNDDAWPGYPIEVVPWDAAPDPLRMMELSDAEESPEEEES